MALKPNCLIVQDEIRFFCSGTASKGKIAVLGQGTDGSGAFMDQGEAYVFQPTTSSGNIPMGVFFVDVVNKDLTQTHLNFQKDETQTGSKVCLIQKGWLVTDAVSGTPDPGDVAYLAANANVSNTLVNSAATPVVGRFLSAKDEDGFVTLSVNLP